MFTNNKMPDGYDDVWKRFGQHWCGKTEEPKKITEFQLKELQEIVNRINNSFNF